MSYDPIGVFQTSGVDFGDSIVHWASQMAAIAYLRRCSSERVSTRALAEAARITSVWVHGFPPRFLGVGTLLRTTGPVTWRIFPKNNNSGDKSLLSRSLLPRTIMFWPAILPHVNYLSALRENSMVQPVAPLIGRWATQCSLHLVGLFNILRLIGTATILFTLMTKAQEFSSRTFT